MTNAKLIAAADIIRTATLDFLATKNGLTVFEVEAAIVAGNPRACEQFRTLVMKGIGEALRLDAVGSISLH